MKKISIFIFLVFLVSCSTNQNLAKQNLKGNFIINKDSISIITPYIEIAEHSNQSFIDHPYKRKTLIKNTIETLKSNYPNSEYIEIPFLFKDYLTINTSLERKILSRVSAVPNELLTSKNNQSIFISLNCYFGDTNRVVLNLYVIDNKNKLWKMIESNEYNNSPLETEKMKEITLRALKKINKI